MAATRLKTRADQDLWTVPEGRQVSRVAVNRFGRGQLTVANPNLVPAIGQGFPGAEPLLPGDSSLSGGVPGIAKPEAPVDAPVSPDLNTPYEAPENPNMTLPASAGTPDPAAENIIPFANETGDEFGPPSPTIDQQIAMERERHARDLADGHAEMDAAEAEFEAMLNGGAAQPQEPAGAPVASPTAPSAQPAPRAKFTGFPKEPITFNGPSPWTSGDEVGFNDSEVQRQNPAWSGSKSWTPRASTMDGPYKTMGTPSSQSTLDQTNRFYQRAALRGDARRVNRYNARVNRNNG